MLQILQQRQQRQLRLPPSKLQLTQQLVTARCRDKVLAVQQLLDVCWITLHAAMLEGAVEAAHHNEAQWN